MNSSAAGIVRAAMIAGTARMHASKSSKGTSSENWQAGSGSSRSMSRVTMPSVPSEPIIRCSRLYRAHLGDLSAQAEQLAAGSYHVHAPDIVAGHAVLDGAHAARVGHDVAAHGGGLFAGSGG